jgi:hypothetical protein
MGRSKVVKPVPGRMDEWVDIKAVLRISYNNKNYHLLNCLDPFV